MHSTSSSVRRVPSAEEEEEPDSTSFRYVPRTLLQGGPFYGSTVRDNSAGNPRAVSRKDSNRKADLKRSKSVSEQSLRKDSRLQFQHASSDNLTSTPLNLSTSDLHKDSNGSHNADTETDQSQSSRNTPEPQARNLDLDDIDIKSIHGEDHYGKLEATPITDHQDRLWTQIDALDDVKRLANSLNLYEGFPPAFEQQLGKLRHAHSRLLKMMRDRDTLLEEESNFNRTDSESTRGHSTRMGKALGGSMSKVVSHPTADGDDNADGGNTDPIDNSPENLGDTTNINNLSIDPNDASAPGGPATNSDNPDTSASNANGLKNQKAKIRSKNNAASASAIQMDEDRYVQDMVAIIKQLRA